MLNRKAYVFLSLTALWSLSLGLAQAQGVGYCDRLKAELAAVENSISSNVNVDLSATLKKTQRELDRTAAYAKSIGCNDMRIPLLSGPAPAKCP